MQDFQEYLQSKARAKLKKDIRYKKPHLFGQALDREVDRVIGISKSSNMDWAAVSAIITPPRVSNYPTKESITEKEILEVGNEYSIRPYILYWFFNKKVQSLESSGRDKTDYLSLLRDVATKSVRRTLTDVEKISAVKLYAKNIKNVELSNGQVDLMVFKGEL